MTLSGWIFLGASWAVILALFVFSMIRTLGPGKGGAGGAHNPDGYPRD